MATDTTKSGSSARHKKFTDNSYTWRSIRDALAGPNTVKRANEIYLPMPQGFRADDESPTSTIIVSQSVRENDYDPTVTPYYHSNPAYQAYLQRARFPGITLNILRGLIGVATREDPVINLPDKLSYLEETATNKGQSLRELFVYCLAEVISQGRAQIAIDIDPKTNQAFMVPYSTTGLINWRENETTGLLTLGVLEEIRCVEGDTEFETTDVPVQIVYSIDNREGTETPGAVLIRKYMDEQLIEGSELVPTLQGETFESIPIVPIGSIHNTYDPNPSPLETIADIAYSIYRKDADLSQAQYMTCNPQFVITGAGSDNKVAAQNFGSTVALLLDNPGADAFFPATDTSALDHVKDAIRDLYNESASHGATIIGAEKATAESTETVRLRKGAQGATLVGAVNNVVKAINEAIAIIGKLNKVTEIEDAFDVSTDFAELMLDAPMLLALISCWQNGLYSKESLIGVLLKTGYVNSADEVEDELTRIFKEGPAVSPMIPSNDPAPPNNKDG